MQKNSEFFRKNPIRLVCGLLLCGICLGACSTKEELTVSTTVETAPALSTTQATTIPRPTERPVTTLPPTPSTTPEPPLSSEADYEWNPYVFDRLAGEYEADARRLVDAILSYAPSVAMDLETAKVLSDNFAFEFPPSALTDLTVTSEGVQISYLYSQSEHDKKIHTFSKNVEKALSMVSAEDGELTRAIKLYDYVVKNVTYFYTDYTDKEITAFSAFTKGVTICYGFADAFGYLLRQTGIEAHLWRGGTYTYNGFSEHGWCYAKIGGAYYHFDPTWDYSAAKNDKINKFIYFGLSDARRFTSLSRQCVSGFGKLEVTCNPYQAGNSLEIEID